MDAPKDLLEAIEFMIDGNVHRYNRKQIAMRLRPNMRGADEEKKADNAKSWLSNCLNPDGDQHFHPDDIENICEITGRADILLHFVADRNGYERTTKKIVLDPATAERILRQVLKDRDINPDEAIKECLAMHKPLFAIKEKGGQ